MDLALPPDIVEERRKAENVINRVLFVPGFGPLYGQPLIFRAAPSIVAPDQNPNEREFISVWLLLSWMAQGMSEAQILKGVPWLEKEDLQACREWIKGLIRISGISLDTPLGN